MVERWGVALLVCALAGCASGASPEETELAPIVTPAIELGDAPEAAAAHAAAEAGRYEDAHTAYERLSRSDPSPERREEFLFLAAECALGAGDFHRAATLYQQLLSDHPGSPRFGLAVERVFQIGRLFCLGIAERPSWFFGIELTSHEFGINILERFRKARERHPLADDALHAIALAHIAMGEYERALSNWEALIREYPDSEWVDTATYRSALAVLRTGAGPRYDKIPLLDAVERLRRYQQKFPTGNHAQEAQAELSRLLEGLAAHDLATARFYLRQSRPYAADLYLAAILRDYPGTASAGEARTLRTSLPRTSPPPASEVTRGLEFEDEKQRADRLRLAPAPIDDSW